MKKLLAILLAMAMVLSIATVFTGCGETATDETKDAEETKDGATAPKGTEGTNPTEGNNQGDNNQGDNNQSGSDALLTGKLLDAAKMLKTVDSYRFVMTSAQNYSDGSYAMANTYKVSKLNNTISFSEKTNYTNSGQTTTRDGDNGYYANTVGYVEDSYNEGIVNKQISDVPFTLEFILTREEGMVVSHESDSVLSLFDSMNPTRTTEADGSIKLTVATTKTQWIALYGSLTDQEMPESVAETLVSQSAYGKISKEGYLSEFCMTAQVSQEGETMSTDLLFTVDAINATTVETPDFVANFQLAEYAEVVYFVGGTDAHYEYNWDYYDSEQKFYMDFRGFGEHYDDSYTVESYTILSEVEGVPVRFMENVVNNGTITVKRLVIPAGVHVDIRGNYGENGFVSGAEETTLFFEDPEAGVDKTFFLLGEQPPADYWYDPVYVKAAYYQGQWEYVDGIPTPL